MSKKRIAHFITAFIAGLVIFCNIPSDVFAEESLSAELYYSKLPVVYIDTENGAEITSKTEYINASMRIQGNEEFNAEDVLYDGDIEIRGRGNSTWRQPKKPYKIKLDKKSNIFDMGKNKHWVLLANYMDESLMRNTLAYDFSGSLGMEHMSTVWVDVVLNGEYIGNYQFCEQIRVDSNRVDIFDWEGFAEDSAAVIAEAEGIDEDDLAEYMLEDMSWITSGKVEINGNSYNIADYPDIQIPSINGGYLLELDEYYDEVSKFKTKSNQPIMFKNPEFVNTNDDMMAYVKNYVQAFEDAVQSSDYTVMYEGEMTHYSDLYDFDALVDYWLINEIFFNEEFNKKSTYMYKEIDGLMMMGPMWDMDYSSGGEGRTGATEHWATLYFNGTNAQANMWYKDLVKDPYFLMKVQERYWEIRNVQIEELLSAIDEHYGYLKESGDANSERWTARQTFESDVAGLKKWMNAHIAWLDEQMATEDSLDASFLSKDTDLSLVVTYADGIVLENDDTEQAPADLAAADGKDLSVEVSEEAEIYVNGRKIAEGTTAKISSEMLSSDLGEKNVIEVKVKDSEGNVVAENYITVKEKILNPINPFTDVSEDAWYYNSVMYAYENGLLTGTSDATFEPNSPMTRGMLVAVLYRMEGRPKVSEDAPTFPDVNSAKYYADAISWAAEENLVSGYKDGTFGPENNITREQIAKILYRYAEYKGYDVTASQSLDGYKDADKVAAYAVKYLEWATAEGLIKGDDGALNPKGDATRAEISAILRRFIEKYE